MKDFDENEIIHNLKIDARAVGIPEGAAEVFVERTIRDAKKPSKVAPSSPKRTYTAPF